MRYRRALQVKEEAVKIIRERGSVDLAELATLLNYNYKYFRYYVLPNILVDKCVEFDSTAHQVRWVCGEGEGSP